MLVLGISILKRTHPVKTPDMVVDSAASIMKGGALRGRLFLAGAFPIPGQELVDPFDRMILQSCEDIGEPGLRVDVVELCGLCRLPNYAERFWKQPVAPAHLRAVERTSSRCHSA